MPQKANNPKEAAKKWQNVNMNNIFSDSARTIGAGSATAAGAGWKIDHPNPIIAAGGIPDSPTLPSKDIMEAFQKVLVQKPSDALKYGGVMGFDGLRNIVAQRQTRLDGLPVKPPRQHRPGLHQPRRRRHHRRPQLLRHHPRHPGPHG